jgi:hypothetical protein
MRVSNLSNHDVTTHRVAYMTVGVVDVVELAAERPCEAEKVPQPDAAGWAGGGERVVAAGFGGLGEEAVAKP